MQTAAHAPPSTARYRSRRSSDVDEHAHQISAWRQEYDQLSRGRFDGLVRELWLDAPPLQVFHEFTGQQTSQRCQPWPGSLWFGIPDGINDGALHFSGARPRQDRPRLLLVARADEGFALRTPQRFGIYGVVVDEAWLAGLGLAPVLPAGCSVRALALPPQRHVALCQTAESMLALAASDTAAQPWGRQTLQDLAGALLRLLADGSSQADSPGERPATVQRRLALVMAARELAATPFGPLLTVDDLCRRLHLTPRTLHNHFQAAVGESPAEFLRAVRLNACRRSLRAHAPAPPTVQEVAAQWGFFHMGRFAQDYRALFGELPSQTLRSARPH